MDSKTNHQDTSTDPSDFQPISARLKFINELSFGMASVGGFLMQEPPDTNLLAFLRLTGLDYKPQGIQDIFEGLMHLNIYWELWPQSRSFLPINALRLEWRQDQERMEAMLDVTLAKIAFKAGILIHSTLSEEQKKSKKAAQIDQLISMKKKAAAKREARILDAFNDARKSQGDTLNKIIKRIHSMLGKESTENYSEITIRRVLDRNKQLMGNCFEKKGRMYVIKSNV